VVGVEEYGKEKKTGNKARFKKGRDGEAMQDGDSCQSWGKTQRAQRLESMRTSIGDEEKS